MAANKLRNDPKVAALIEKEVQRAVKAERRLILEEIKAIKLDIADALSQSERQVVNSAITSINKAIRARNTPAS